MKQKEQDNLRMILLKKQNEAKALKRKEDVQGVMVERLIAKQEKIIERAREQE